MISNIFKDNSLIKKTFKLKTSNATEEVRNWYQDRYNILHTQRNILIVVIFSLIICGLYGLFLIKDVTLSKTVKPFVIEIDDRNGDVNLVKNATIEEMTANDAVNRHFIVQYVTARETYNFMTYKYNTESIVRLMSNNEVYANFIRNSKNDNPARKYSSNTVTTIFIKSLQFLDVNQDTINDLTRNGTLNVKIVQIRFRLTEEGLSSNQSNKIVTMSYIFDNEKQMTIEDRYINPLGFKVVKYRIDNESTM